MTMPFLPNEADATYDDQAEPDSVDFEILLAGHGLTGVVSGCEVTESGTPAQTVDVAVGVVRVAGKTVSVSAQADESVTAANATNPRIDLITVNSSGSVVVTAGTAAAQPVAPAIPATSVPLAFLYVPANDNTHGNAQINDKRVFVPAQTVFDVAAYGATGDGTDETTEIQAAFTAAAVNGGEVFFPYGSTGTYAISTTITADVDVSVTIADGVTIDNTTASTGYAFEFTGAGVTDTGKSMGVFRGGIIDCNATGNSGIRISDGYGYRVVGVKAHGSSTGAVGFRADYANETGQAYCHFIDCHAFDFLTAGFNADGSGTGAGWANRNTIRGCWAYGCGTGLLFNDCDTWWVQIATEDCTVGIDLADSRLNYVHHLSEGDTTSLDMGSGDGHVLIGSWTTIDAATATNCSITGSWVTVNNGPIEGSDHVSNQQYILGTARTTVPRFHVVEDRRASATFTTGSWPGTASDAIAYVDFDNTDMFGEIVVRIHGTYFVNPAVGTVEKRYTFWHAADATSISYSSSECTVAFGEIVDLFSLGEPEIHTTNKVRIPIYRLTDNETGDFSVYVRIEEPGNTTAALTILDGTTITAPALSAHAAVANVVTQAGPIDMQGNTLRDANPANEYAAAHTLDWDDNVVNMESTAATRAVTLPDNATFSGKSYLIRRDGSNDVTITRAGSDTFDDAATSKTLGSDGAAIGIFSIGDGEWKIVGTEGTVT